MINKKAQTGIIWFIFAFMLFIVIWFVWLGGWLNQVGQLAIDSGGLTGLEAFAFANLNLILALVILLAFVFYATFGGSSQ